MRTLAELPKVGAAGVEATAAEVARHPDDLARYAHAAALVGAQRWREALDALRAIVERNRRWTEGAYGYFPCYTLGAMYAAQWFATLRRTRPALDAEIARGDLDGIFGWLRVNIWQQASRFETDELTRRASGEALDPKHLRAHLEARYLG